MKTFKKIFSCALIVISFILLFTSWTILTPHARTATVDYYNALVAEEDQVTNFPQVVKAIRSLDVDEFLASDQASSEAKTLVEAIYHESSFRTLAAALLNEGLDVSQTTLAARTVRSIYQYLYEQNSAFGLKDEVSYLKTTGALSVYNTVVTVIFILTILLAVATFLVRFLDRFKQFRKYDLAYFIAMLLLFIMTVIFVSSTNSMFPGTPVLGITLWGIIALILACPSVFLERLPFEKAELYTGRGTLMNDTAYAVSGTVSKTMDRISNKVDETTQGVRLVRELKLYDEQLKDRYLALGKQYYEANAELPPEAHSEAFQEISELRAVQARIQKDIDTVNNVVVCENCGTRWTAGTRFCANCGTRLPSIEEDREEFDYEMKQKKEKKAGKSFCKYCGAKVEEDDDFCPGCGRSI